MKTAIVRLYHPADFFGRLICWRLETNYSHATIQFGSVIYSATYPKVVAVAPSDLSFGMPPRTGYAYTIQLTDEEYERGEYWFKAQVGSQYDVLAMLAWAFRIPSLASKTKQYCYESVYNCLAAAGVFSRSVALITGDQLLVELFQSGRIASGYVPTDVLVKASI